MEHTGQHVAAELLLKKPSNSVLEHGVRTGISWCCFQDYEVNISVVLNAVSQQLSNNLP
jgi:hypothetical protein